ncbi:MULTISPECIES: chemotaxis protein CheW [Geobacter]|uniref:chemotaxis protein CheW n=1 Tax=Geobacter TaxID=28231 RepID=UPI0025741F29|nr:chemotaxis protein CheW [Geobacter sulfurreducens]BET59574.1 chemotaxis protein CheW [Geobacter sp. 60473]HML77011.1 chemotaxis protein CheW [Geobacter sulfurreducens]
MSDRMDRYVIFTVTDRKLALPLDKTAEVLEGAATHPVPAVPPLLGRALNVHGRIMPALDLATFLHGGAIGRNHAFLALNHQVSDLALLVEGPVVIVSVEDSARSPSEHPRFEGYLEIAGERVGVLATGRLIEEVEEIL